jgi:hypothetical protein
MPPFGRWGSLSHALGVVEVGTKPYMVCPRSTEVVNQQNRCRFQRSTAPKHHGVSSRPN